MTNTKESTIKVVRDERGRFVKKDEKRPFQMGDRVKGFGYFNPIPSYIGVIESINGDIVYIRLTEPAKDNGNMDHRYVSLKSLILLSDKPKTIPTPRPFKVGDVVKRVNRPNQCANGRVMVGMVGIISRVLGSGFYCVDWNNGLADNGSDGKNLELVPNAPKQRKAEKKAEAPKFNVGDKVKIIKECSSHYHKIGDVGTIIMDDGSDVMRFVVEVGSKSQYMDSKWLEHVKDDEKPLTIEVPEEIPAALQTLAKAFGYRVEKA